jgi:gliding motility-associated-like protein
VLKNVFILLLVMCARAFGQALPANIGFEQGSINGWNCREGSIDADGNLKLFDSQQIKDRHTLLTRVDDGAKKDYYGNFPVLCPNGSNYSVRLGNEEVNSQAESLYYTFIVPANATNGYSITFNYAVVFQNPDHVDFEQPRFTARVYDVTEGKYVDCPYLEFAAGSALPGFQLSNVKPRTGNTTAKEAAVYFKDWSSATIDLSQYLGKQVRIEFITNDCTKGGHFGYAYLDVDEKKSATPIGGNTYCAGQADITLRGPEGFAKYEWRNLANDQLVGESQNLVLEPPPPDQTAYRLKVTPYPDLGCPSDFKTELVRMADAFTLVTHEITGCPETGADLTNSAVTAGSTPGLEYSYFTDASLRTHVLDSTHVALSGTYYIMGVGKSGCKDVLPVNVKFVTPDININDPVPVRYPGTVDLSKTFTHDPDFTYSYFSVAKEGVIPLTNYTAVNKTGNYFIKSKNNFGCEIGNYVHVDILPPLPFVVDAPNVFTPNNDGINDKFGLRLDGFIKFNSIDIFNRNGQLIFSAKSQADLWDGNFNGRPLPTGTYYWIFSGLDTYYNLSVSKNGYVSIIR